MTVQQFFALLILGVILIGWFTYCMGRERGRDDIWKLLGSPEDDT